MEAPFNPTAETEFKLNEAIDELFDIFVGGLKLVNNTDADLPL